MQTQSHLLIAGLMSTQLQRRGIPMRHRAWWSGSVLPDIPLALLTMVSTLYYRWFSTLVPADEVHELLHFQFFFKNPWWIASHNFFHSLLIGALLLGVGWWFWRNQKSWGATLMWFALGTMLHTTLDIFTHHSDGPVFLFPLTWSYRFQSLISYWETAYYGRQFTLFEILLDGLLFLYFAIEWLWNRRRSRDQHFSTRGYLQED